MTTILSRCKIRGQVLFHYPSCPTIFIFRSTTTFPQVTVWVSFRRIMSCWQQFWSRNTIWLAVKSSVPWYGRHLYVIELSLFQDLLIICMYIHSIYFIGPEKISTRIEIHFVDGYYSYAHDFHFHTVITAIDGHVCYSIQLIPGPAKYV